MNDFNRQEFEARLPESQAKTEARLAEFATVMKTGFARVEAGFAELRAEMGRMNGELGRMQGELGRMQGELGRMHGDMGRMHGDMGRMHGEMQKIASGIIKWVCGILIAAGALGVGIVALVVHNALDKQAVPPSAAPVIINLPQPVLPAAPALPLPK